MHPPLCRVHPLQWTDQGLDLPWASFRGPTHKHKQRWPLGGPLPPSTGCFTLSSPATMAEGLCLYNSGYLHWVRKYNKHTHTHTHASFNLIIHLRRFISSTVGQTVELLSMGTVAGMLSYLLKPFFLFIKLQDGLSIGATHYWSLHVWYLIVRLLVLETLLRCLLLKCWQVFFFFSALLQRRTGISAIHKTSSADSRARWCEVVKFKGLGGLQVTGLRWATEARKRQTTQIQT